MSPSGVLENAGTEMGRTELEQSAPQETPESPAQHLCLPGLLPSWGERCLGGAREGLMSNPLCLPDGYINTFYGIKKIIQKQSLSPPPPSSPSATSTTVLMDS